MIPILDLKKQIAPIRAEIDAAIKKVIDETNFVFGKEIGEFENDLAAYSQAKYAVGVSNGTDAIVLSLAALGIKAEDGVICPAFTYYATAGAVASMGIRPVFCDIEPDTFTISITSIEKALKQQKKLKIKAIIPVHLYGLCADMDQIMKIARKYKLKVVEDTAQAFGAEYLPAGRQACPAGRQVCPAGRRDKGKKAGTIGDCGALSLFPGKNLGAFGDAGAILTNNKNIAEKLKLYRNQGNKIKYRHEVIGYNHRLDTIQAAILRVKLRYYDGWNKIRREVADFYREKLKDLAILKTPLVPEYTTHIYHQYVLRLNTSSEKLIAHLRSKNIDARVYYPIPLHLQKCFKYLGYKKGDFPESERTALQTVAIPVYPDLTQDEKEHIVSSIREFLK